MEVEHVGLEGAQTLERALRRHRPGLPETRVHGLSVLWVFLISGLVHEAVITLPAGGGHGGPTAYFLLQAAGLLAERTSAGRRLGLGRGAVGRVFTFVVATAPLPLLFPPVFVREVILPMLQSLSVIR